jgi:hypothetical protein
VARARESEREGWVVCRPRSPIIPQPPPLDPVVEKARALLNTDMASITLLHEDENGLCEALVWNLAWASVLDPVHEQPVVEDIQECLRPLLCVAHSLQPPSANRGCLTVNALSSSSLWLGL